MATYEAYCVKCREKREFDGEVATHLGNDLRGKQRVPTECEKVGVDADPIDAEDPHVLAQMVEAALALPAGVVDDMSFRRNVGPRFNFSNVRTNGDHPAGHLVPEDPGRADMATGPVIPIEDVDVGTTDGRRGHLDQNILAGWLGDGNLIDLGARAGSGLHHCRHGRHGFILASAKPVS